jgi:hypothetical protein
MVPITSSKCIAAWHAENLGRGSSGWHHMGWLFEAYHLGESNEVGAVVTSQLLAVTFADHCLRV